MHRRKFLTVSAASAALAALGETSAVIAAAPNVGRRFSGFSRAQFAAWIDQDFHITPYGSLRRVRATLTAVEDRITAPGLEQFSVMFRGASTLPQGPCSLWRADGTHFTLHLQGAPSSVVRRADFALLEARDV
jgi:hypothetical protein